MKVTCGTCGGCGQVDLTGKYADTFTALSRHREEVTGASLAKELGAQATAVNNRLARLEELGLATSRRYGRLRLFKAINGRKS